jgi:hypothetical protein
MSNAEEDETEKLVIPKDLNLEGLYNCDYTVRYHEIEHDLLERMRMRQIKILEAEYNAGFYTGEIPYNKPTKKEFYYTNADINSICNKIYKDEFLSVFYADNIEDDNINTQMRLLYMLLTSHPGFKSIITDMIEILYKLGMTNTDEELRELQRQSKPIIFSTMFSQPLFYITHQCIIQMIRIRDIQPELITLLRNKSVDKFNEDGSFKDDDDEDDIKISEQVQNVAGSASANVTANGVKNNIELSFVEPKVTFVEPKVKLEPKVTVVEQKINVAEHKEEQATKLAVEKTVKKPRAKIVKEPKEVKETKEVKEKPKAKPRKKKDALLSETV